MSTPRFTLLITSDQYDNNRKVTISIPLSCLGGRSEAGFYRQWLIADHAKNAVFSSILDGDKVKQIQSAIDSACANKPWKAIMNDVELSVAELEKLGFGCLAEHVKMNS